MNPPRPVRNSYLASGPVAAGLALGRGTFSSNGSYPAFRCGGWINSRTLTVANRGIVPARKNAG